MASDPTNFLNPSGAAGEMTFRRTYTIRNLENGSAYLVQVAARSGAGLGHWSAAAEGTPGGAPSQLPAPVLSLDYGVGNTAVLNVVWTIPTDPASTGGAPITAVHLEWRYIASDPTVPWNRVDDLTGTMYQIDNVIYRRNIQVRLLAENRFGEAQVWSSPTTVFVTLPPERMAAPTLTAGRRQPYRCLDRTADRRPRFIGL